MEESVKKPVHAMPPLIDAHAHLELEPLVSDYENVVRRAAEVGVVAIVTVGIDLDDARVALQIAERCDRVFVCAGFHPHNARFASDDALSDMERLADHPKVVGYGEVGLDYFRNHSPRDRQIEAFRVQLKIAKKLGKPVVIHLRDAYDEGLHMLETEAPFPSGGLIHCFSGAWEDAVRALELGFHLSIPGTVTYKKNETLRTVVSRVPDDRFVLETDCPFLAPEPFRGKDNEPALILHTAVKVAEVRRISVEEVCKTTTANAARLFHLPI